MDGRLPSGGGALSRIEDLASGSGKVLFWPDRIRFKPGGRVDQRGVEFGNRTRLVVTAEMAKSVALAKIGESPSKALAGRCLGTGNPLTKSAFFAACENTRGWTQLEFDGNLLAGCVKNDSGTSC